MLVMRGLLNRRSKAAHIHKLAMKEQSVTSSCSIEKGEIALIIRGSAPFRNCEGRLHPAFGVEKRRGQINIPVDAL